MFGSSESWLWAPSEKKPGRKARSRSCFLSGLVGTRMFQALIAFLTVLSGYVFVSTWHRTRFLLLRQPSQRIYFRAAFWGVWLFVLAIALVVLLHAYVGPLIAVVFSLLPENALGSSLTASDQSVQFLAVTAVFVVILGATGGFFLNWCELLSPWPESWKARLLTALERRQPLSMVLYGLTSLKPLEAAINYLNADFERIVLKALSEEKPVCMSMADRKVYVGYLSGSVDPSDVNDMIRLLPYMSGYRSAESLELVFTDYYDLIYKAIPENGSGERTLDQSEFELALPIRDIRSCRLFDTSVYLKYQESRTAEGVGFM